MMEILNGPWHYPWWQQSSIYDIILVKEALWRVLEAKPLAYVPFRENIIRPLYEDEKEDQQ